MNIAMFSDCYLPRINGVSISIKSFAYELSKNGHNVTIICPSYDESDKEQVTFEQVDDAHKIAVYRISSLVFIFSKEDRFAKITEWHSMKKYLDNFKPDVIHANTEYVVGRFAYYYAKHRKLPLVYTFHTYWETYIKNYAQFVPTEITRFFGRKVSMYFLERSDRIIAPTARFAEVVESYGIKSNISILPTGITDPFISYDKGRELQIGNLLKEHYPDIDNSKVLLYVGRIAKEKNLDFLISAFTKIHEIDENTVLLFVGDGPELPALKKNAQKSKYNKNIIFTGYFNREDLPYVYHKAKVFVFSSLTETQGLVTIEAMTMGLPVVAIGEMGTLDLMQGNHGGFMTKNDVQEFVDRVLLLLSDKEIYDQKIQEAFEWSKKWSISETANELMNVYKDTIDLVKKSQS